MSQVILLSMMRRNWPELASQYDRESDAIVKSTDKQRSRFVDMLELNQRYSRLVIEQLKPSDKEPCHA